MGRHETYELGTAIKITTILSVASPTSVSITIKDTSNVVLINSVAMTEDTTTVFSYVFQSNTTGLIGDYIVIIDAVYGTYTSRAVTKFTTVDNDL